jgi:two-component system nitrogen regulation response regulator GlnG/two-component system response regulator HydG
MHDTTIEPESDGPAPESSTAQVLALVVLASVHEPQRVGEVAFVPLHSRGEGVTLGRGEGTTPGELRMCFGRQRPGSFELRGPLTDPSLSRHQLRLRYLDPSTLEVQNVGRIEVLKNGREVAVGSLRPGECLSLAKRLLLLCEARPAPLRAWPGFAESFAFGQADHDGIVGESAAAWELRRQIAFVAPRAGHVLIRGPSGTGKELVAQAVHRLSPRNALPLVARNACTIPESLLDAELFGNVRNYPQTGMPVREGLVGEAANSSLFLDEFAELAAASQAHLLRVLDAGEYQPLGASRPKAVDLRLIAATNRPESSLRPDLAARFTWRVEVPSLRERWADVPLIARTLLAQLGEGARAAELLTPDRIQQLLSRPLETNVREVRSWLAEQLQGGRSRTTSWPAPRAPEPNPKAKASEAETRHRETDGETPHADGSEDDASGLSPERIQRELDRHNGVVSEAFKALGLSSRHALTRLIRKHRLELRRRPT